MWHLAARANASMASRWDPVVDQAVGDLGVDRTTLVMLSFLLVKEPAAMTLEDFAELSPYSAPTFFTARLRRAAEAGLASEHSEGVWRLRPDGRQDIERLHQDIAGAVAAGDPLGPATSARLAQLLGNLVDASAATPAPPMARMSWYMHRLISGADPPPARVLRCLVYLEAYRSDAHQDAWRGCALSATAAEVLSALWHRGRSLADVCELLAVREHGCDVYADALSDLRERGLVAGAEEGAALTPAGKELRAELEATTDRLFFVPWECLSVEEITELAGLLSVPTQSSG